MVIGRTQKQSVEELLLQAAAVGKVDSWTPTPIGLYFISMLPRRFQSSEPRAGRWPRRQMLLRHSCSHPLITHLLLLHKQTTFDGSEREFNMPGGPGEVTKVGSAELAVGRQTLTPSGGAYWQYPMSRVHVETYGSNNLITSRTYRSEGS